MNIRVVAVIGANGTMGSIISGFFASSIGATVYMVGRNLEKVKSTALQLTKSAKDEGLINRLIPADYSELCDCVKNSDLVFESVAEDYETKKSTLAMIAQCIKPGTPVCSGSSGLSMTELAASLPSEAQASFFGVHFFNPPQYMKLCEFNPTLFSDKGLAVELKSFLVNELGRKVVEVKDSPAYIGNRIGFLVLNHALQLAAQFKGKGGIDYVDALFGNHVGIGTAPIAVADFVGLDVHKSIVDNIHQHTNDYNKELFVLPPFCETLIREHKLGRKSGGGLYKLVKHEDGQKEMQVYDIEDNSYRPKKAYQLDFVPRINASLAAGDYPNAMKMLTEDESDEGKLCLSLLLEYIVYSLYISRDIGFDIHLADDAMAYGYGWCPPLALIDALSSVVEFKGLLESKSVSLFETAQKYHLFDLIEPSKHDYKSFIKPEKKREQ